MSSAGQEAVELAASAGLILDPWQQDGMHAALGERADGKWAAFEVGLIVPRQNGKGSILEARELAGLFLFGEELILHSAHEFKTAAEAFRRVWSLVQGTPDLERRVARVRTSHGEEGIELKGGQRLRFVARSTGSGRGFTGDVIILDEAYNLSAEAMAALLPTMAARSIHGNPQLWYASSAPHEREESAVLRRLCRRGRSGDSKSLAYIEYCASHKDADLDDRREWAGSNPGLGIRITEEFIEREREALGDDEFARERLGIWFEDADLGEHVIPPEDWAACQFPDTKAGGNLSFALDVSIDRASAAFGVAGVSNRDGTHIEVIDHRSGTKWLVARAVQLQKRWKAPIAIAQNSPAWAFQPALEREGVELVPITPSEHAQACGQLYDAAVDRALRHLGQPELDKAVRGAERRVVSDSWVWSRKASEVDICPLVAVTLAHRVHAAPSPPATAPSDPASSRGTDLFRPKERLSL